MTSFAAAWRWGTLLVLGQAAALVLAEAGPRVSYQHLRAPTSTVGWAALALLVLQAVCVGRALAPRMAAIRGWTRDQVPVAARWILVAAFLGTSAVASKEPVMWAAELVATTTLQAVALGNIILLGFALPGGSLRGNDTPAARPWRDPVAWCVAGFVLVVASVLAVFAYERHPHVPDEVAYLLQARYFADGRLWLPAPPAPLAFNLDLLHYEATRFYTPTPPGWPALLALGVLAGVPWLVNPLLGAANVLLAHRVFVGMFDGRTARLATVLLGSSPWFVFMSMNFMTHQATLGLALLGAVAVLRVREARARHAGASPRTAITTFLGGLAIGAASIVRPLEGLAIALLLGFWSLPARWWTRWRDVLAFVPSAVLALGAIAAGALVRPYNTLMTGKASYFPIMAYIDKYYTAGSNDLGFGANRGLGWSGLDPFPGHGVIDVVINAALNLAALNQEWLGWATGSVLALLLVFVLRRWSRADTWHGVVLVSIVVVHSFYWFSGGPDFGARYWFLIIVSCAALTARGLVELDARLPGTRDRAVRAALVLVAASWVTFVPWRAVDKYHRYRGMRPDIRQLSRASGFGRGVVFIRGARHPDYASAAAYNPLDLTADATLYAWDVSPEGRAEALTVYRDRPVYFVDGPTVTKRGFEVVAGPLSAEQALVFPRVP
ncbi:MAG: hypothetical protein IPK85_11885 [Gemmatimonadetes bacterium]|nr:hypothetical protein [Gemmatimonadota bacterium]